MRMSMATTARRLRIDVEERGLAAAHGIAGRALDDGAVFEQVVDDQADGAAADAHGAGQVGARERLAGADEVQRRWCD